jgi:hypothetical protein
MSEWQPVRLRLVHDWKGPKATDTAPEALEFDFKPVLLHVRPTTVPVRTHYWREVGCDATEFYEIRQDDAERLFPWRRGGVSILCEHEILTDSNPRRQPRKNARDMDIQNMHREKEDAIAEPYSIRRQRRKTVANRKPKRKPKGIFLTETEKDVLIQFLEQQGHCAEESRHYKGCTFCRIAVKLTSGPR